MYHIAVCDDDGMFVEYIKKIIKESWNEDEKELKFYEYSSGEELIKSMMEMLQYDLLILDMQLGGMNGDETARLFRKKFPDAVLVFCSGVRTPTIQSFKATPFRYLLKSHSDDEFQSEMREILKEMVRCSKDLYIIGHYRKNMVKVRLKNILYIENAKRGSRVVVSPSCEEARFEEMILVNEKIVELSERFPQLVFAHSSYVVNIEHVDYVNSTGIVLDSGEMLSVSRLYQKSFREVFTRSIAGKY